MQLFQLDARREQDGLRFFLHKSFELDMYLLIKGFRATSWNTKDFNIGGSGLARINFASSSSKFIDTLKYFQKVF